MKIAIASGKGGTGKTSIATNLAHVASRNGARVTYLDCDVEEPNGRIFLKPIISERRSIETWVPFVDEQICGHCGKCGEICQYSAIVSLGGAPLVYPELCHSCGGCTLVCPTGAINEISRSTGRLEIGKANSIRFVQGILNIGEAMSVPSIKAVKAAGANHNSDLVIIDAPPGTSCPVIETVYGCDYVILVTEPTPFGLHDLQLAVKMIRALELPFGVIINRAGIGNRDVHLFCRNEGIEIIAEIPDNRRIAEAYSRGALFSESLKEYEPIFMDILDKLKACHV